MLAQLLVASSAMAQLGFTALDTNHASQTVRVSSDSRFKTQILFVGGVDSVYNSGLNAYGTARQWHDFLGYTAIDDNSAYITINHEMQIADAFFGDGGGMTVFKVTRDIETDTFKFVRYATATGTSCRFRSVDFSGVGGTLTNCGGIQMSNGRIFTAEEYGSSSNTELANGRIPAESGFSNGSTAQDPGAGQTNGNNQGITATADRTVNAPGHPYNGESWPAYMHYLQMVEIDPATATATKRYYNMGRFGHEGGVVAPGDTVMYLTDDNTPAIFYKFKPANAGDFNVGTLYAYKQDTTDGIGGSWIAIPDNTANMQAPTTYALGQGATMFIRHEWIDMIDGKVYIAETGNNSVTSALSAGRTGGGKLAHHLAKLDSLDYPAGTPDNKIDFGFNDYYGRVLEFDPATNTMRVYLEGGPYNSYAGDGKNNLSNPDGLCVGYVGGRKVMIIGEDLNGVSFQRSGTGKYTVPEIYVLDMSITNPTVADLERIVIGPRGSEMTGVRITPDGKTLMFNSQHPSQGSTGKYANSLTFAIHNLDDLLAAVFEAPVFTGDANKFQVYPNPVTGLLYFNKTTDATLYDAQGNALIVERNTNRMDVSGLTPGVYFVQTIAGEVTKVVVE